MVQGWQALSALTEPCRGRHCRDGGASAPVVSCVQTRAVFERASSCDDERFAGIYFPAASRVARGVVVRCVVLCCQFYHSTFDCLYTIVRV